MNHSPKQVAPSWETFIEQLRARLKPEEVPFLDRATSRVRPEHRERIAMLGIDVAIAELRREMGGSATLTTTREDEIESTAFICNDPTGATTDEILGLEVTYTP